MTRRYSTLTDIARETTVDQIQRYAELRLQADYEALEQVLTESLALGAPGTWHRISVVHDARSLSPGVATVLPPGYHLHGQGVTP